jgi:hypothetical protein
MQAVYGDGQSHICEGATGSEKYGKIVLKKKLRRKKYEKKVREKK